MSMMVPRQTAELADGRLRALEQQMRYGWRIESPVIERSIFHAANGSGRGYEVILCHQQTRQVLALPDTPAVREFMAQLDISIVTI